MFISLFILVLNINKKRLGRPQSLPFKKKWPYNCTLSLLFLPKSRSFPSHLLFSLEIDKVFQQRIIFVALLIKYSEKNIQNPYKWFKMVFFQGSEARHSYTSTCEVFKVEFNLSFAAHTPKF